MSDPGQTDESLVDGLAAAAADGKEVDWAAVRAQTSDPNDLRLIRELEILSSLAKAPSRPVSQWPVRWFGASPHTPPSSGNAG